LAWSYILDYENSRSNHQQKKDTIQKWQSFAIEDTEETQDILLMGEKIQATGIKSIDSLHIACAISMKCDNFISVDRRLLKYRDSRIVLCDPIEFIRIWEGEIL
jgi:predicted nucleic acid-binding protein